MGGKLPLSNCTSTTAPITERTEPVFPCEGAAAVANERAIYFYFLKEKKKEIDKKFRMERIWFNTLCVLNLRKG